MNHALEHTRTRHMYPVIVARTQVQGRKQPILIAGSLLSVSAYQSRRRVTMPLRLEHLGTLDRPQLADGTINRADQGRLRDRAGPRTQSSTKKLVKGGVAGWVGVFCLAHVDLITVDKTLDSPGRAPAHGLGGQAA